MITATQEESDLSKQNQEINLLNAKALRGLRNTFCRQYADGSLSAEELSALLLCFVQSHLQRKSNIPRQFLQSEHLFALLEELLPVGIKQTMPMPNKESLLKASSFFELPGLKKFQDILFQDIANLGFAYQIFSLGIRNNKALPSVQSANKTIDRQSLIAFTQLYTPNWVVDFLVSNTVLPGLALEEKPERYQGWLIDKRIIPLNQTQLSNFSLLDPACGAGQFLFSAFDLFFCLYKQAGYSNVEAINNLLNHNLYGADIDAKALWVTGLGLFCQCLTVGGQPPDRLNNLAWADQNSNGQNSFLGSIDRSWQKEHFLGQTHSAIVTNPPYLGRKCLSREIKAALKEQYPNSSSDLCTAFLERCAQMLKPDGRLGIITQTSLISIPSYQSLRNYLLNHFHFQSLVRCGPGVFPLAGGEKIDSVLLLIQAPQTREDLPVNRKTSLVDLRQQKYKAQALHNILNNPSNGDNPKEQISIISQTEMLGDQISGLSVSLSSRLSKKLSQFPKLGEIAEIKQGLATTNNGKFVRYFFDLAPELIGSVWVPYIKGAGGERFSSANPFLVKWGNNGEQIKQAVAKAYPYLKGKTAWVVKNEEFYFRPGLCFSFVNKSGLAVRRLPAGAIFDVASSAIFAKSEDEDFLLAYLNSSPLSLLTKSINQTINVQVGDLKKIPVLPFSHADRNELARLGKESFLVKEKLLQLEHINASLLYKGTEPTLFSAEHLRQIFAEHANQQNKLLKELDHLQSAIDQKVLTAIEQILALKAADRIHLSQWLDSLSMIEEKNQSTKQSLIVKILTAIISNLLINGRKSERPIFLPDATRDNLAKLFNLSADAQEYLESALGQSLQHFFCRPKLVNISKLAGQPSRYFSIWLKENNCCIFFSARSVHNADNSPFWQPIHKELSKIEDWTSKDLIKVMQDGR